MKLKEIYREAARRIAEGEERYACCAIDAVVGCRPHSKERQIFEESFAPRPEEVDPYNLRITGEIPYAWGWLAAENCSDTANRHARVMLLLFAAEALS